MKQNGVAVRTKNNPGSEIRICSAAKGLCVVYGGLYIALFGLSVFIFERMDQFKAAQLRSMDRVKLLEEKPILCLPCSQVSLHPADDAKNFLRLHVTLNRTKPNHCCARDGDQLSYMLYLVAERKYRIAKARGTFDVPKIIFVHPTNGTHDLSRHKPSAHLLASQGSYLDKRSSGPEFPQIIPMWHHQSGNAFVSEGLEYKNGRLIVRQEGTYYIYSNVAFLNFYTDKKQEALSDHATMHIIARYNVFYPNGGEERLFEAMLSQCWAKDKKYGEYVSHLGGIMKLNKNDEVYVKVRDIMNLVVRPTATYFGAYML